MVAHQHRQGQRRVGVPVFRDDVRQGFPEGGLFARLVAEGDFTEPSEPDAPEPARVEAEATA